MNTSRVLSHVGLLIILWLISACGESTPLITATKIPSSTVAATKTTTPLPPSPTPIPLAATVNGEEITLQEYEAELNRYLSVQSEGSTLVEQEGGNVVLDDMVNQILLAQGAEKSGFELDQEILSVRREELVEAVGGEQAFDSWLLETGYTQQSFDEVLARAIQGAWMRDQILEQVPKSTEQVHARQILLYNSDQANQVLAELNSGSEFATLVVTYEPVTQGELGWFPRGYLPHLAIEEAAFSLQPGEYSQVIETSVGFHIIQVVERDSNRPLSPEARLVWQEQTLQEWVAMQREESEIVILIPQGSE